MGPFDEEGTHELYPVPLTLVSLLRSEAMFQSQ